MSHNPKSTKRGRPGPQVHLSRCKTEKQRKGGNAERDKRPDEWNEAFGGKWQNRTNYREEKREKREEGGQNKHSVGRMCYDEEEINRKEEAEMKQGRM